jgi:tetratricopeptide (TPR) repeat protein
MTGRVKFLSCYHRWIACVFFAIRLLPLSSQPYPQSELTSLLTKAREAEKNADFASAEETYRQALQLAPDNLEVLKRLGVVEQTELKFADSIGHFKVILARDTHYPEVHFFLGVSYLGGGDAPNAIQSFQDELNLPKPHPRCHYYLGIAYESAGQIEAAIGQFNAALTEDAKDADSLYQLARIYKNASMEAIDRLRALDPNSFQLHVLQGEVYSDGERYSEAIQEYQAALGARPDATGIHFPMGVAYWAQHQIEHAKQEFLEALKENPSDPLTNLYLGDIAVGDREYNNALGYLAIASQGNVDPFRVHLLLGKAHRGQRQLVEAKAEFLAAAEMNPKVPEVHYLLAQVYQELKDTQGSKKEFAEFQRLSQKDHEKELPSNPPN